MNFSKENRLLVWFPFKVLSGQHLHGTRSGNNFGKIEQTSHSCVICPDYMIQRKSRFVRSNRLDRFKEPSLQNSQKKEETMFFSRTKTQNLFAATILVCAAVLCCKAEAAPKNYGNKQGDSASANIATQIGKTTDSATCYVYNKSDKGICVVYDVYPVWNFAQPSRGTVSEFIPAKTGLNIVWAFLSQQASMQCKLVSATYIPWYALCP